MEQARYGVWVLAFDEDELLLAGPNLESCRRSGAQAFDVFLEHQSCYPTTIEPVGDVVWRPDLNPDQVARQMVDSLVIAAGEHLNAPSFEERLAELLANAATAPGIYFIAASLRLEATVPGNIALVTAPASEVMDQSGIATMAASKQNLGEDEALLVALGFKARPTSSRDFLLMIFEDFLEELSNSGALHESVQLNSYGGTVGLYKEAEEVVAGGGPMEMANEIINQLLQYEKPH